MNAIQTLALVTFVLLVLIPIEGKSKPSTLHENGITTSPISPWVKNIGMRGRVSGCGGRSWECNQGEFPPRSLCCRNHCVNVTSDKYNCGLCGMRCPFNWECCEGLCSNTNLSIFNCGKCGHRCAFGALCIFGICGYA
ncbi:hypothetical protein VNO78_27614 [Psophocarpus tetragonolobus]|uniref:Stigma-specific Stig1 family protein n=1 Tax=Psophocarpus tetragonolobus TaxID=3891 RepID=A0AAN9XCG6_PSOTE